MDIDKQVIKLYLLPLFLVATVKNVAGSIGHGPGLIPVPVVVGWTKYVPQNVPPHAWTTTYLNTGLKVLPPPPYYTPAYPQPIIPVTQPIVPVSPAVTPVAPFLPPPTFNSKTPLLPAPTFNSIVPVSPPPVFNGNTPVFRAPGLNPIPRPEDPLAFPVAQNPQSAVSDSDNGIQSATSSGGATGYPVTNNYLTPIVAYPERNPSLLPFTRPAYSVTETHEPQHVYGSPQSSYPVSPYPSKYRSTPSDIYGPPRPSGNKQPRYREYFGHSSVPQIVRVVRPKYSSAEIFK